MEAELRVRMGTNRFLQALLLAICLPALAQSQSSRPSVRHHRVEENPDAAKLTEAETDIGKHDYASAEPLLKEIVASHPENYAAWYDLGFVYHALGRRDDSIAAYRKSVEAKPDVFESNLNLGLALAEVGDAQAEQYLRAATKLHPASNPTQGHMRAWLALGRVLATTKPEEAVSAFQQAANL